MSVIGVVCTAVLASLTAIIARMLQFNITMWQWWVFVVWCWCVAGGISYIYEMEGENS